MHPKAAADGGTEHYGGAGTSLVAKASSGASRGGTREGARARRHRGLRSEKPAVLERTVGAARSGASAIVKKAPRSCLLGHATFPSLAPPTHTPPPEPPGRTTPLPHLPCPSRRPSVRHGRRARALSEAACPEPRRIAHGLLRRDPRQMITQARRPAAARSTRQSAERAWLVADALQGACDASAAVKVTNYIARSRWSCGSERRGGGRTFAQQARPG